MAGRLLVCLLPAVLATGCGGSSQAPDADDAVEWSYEGPGSPENWAFLSAEFALCGDGRQQSPIDITGYETGDGASITFSYGGDATAVRNDGKFVHVDYGPGNTFSVGRQVFELRSAHLHSPSEHLIDGVSFAAEMHLVHEGVDGDLAVVGLLFRLGGPSAMVQGVLDAAPAAGARVTGGVALDAGGYTPEGPDHYRYDGSKTTPPCDEPVDWYVMRQPKTISAEQVDGLLALSGGPNNRPVQPRGGRRIILGGGPS